MLDLAAIGIALEREAVARRSPVHAPSSAEDARIVANHETRVRAPSVAIEVLRVHAELAVVAEGAAMPEGSAPLEVSAAAIGVGTLRLRGRVRDDVDDAVHRIGAPERAGGTADHLDAL